MAIFLSAYFFLIVLFVADRVNLGKVVVFVGADFGNEAVGIVIVMTDMFLHGGLRAVNVFADFDDVGNFTQTVVDIVIQAVTQFGPLQLHFFLQPRVYRFVDFCQKLRNPFIIIISGNGIDPHQ